MNKNLPTQLTKLSLLLTLIYISLGHIDRLSTSNLEGIRSCRWTLHSETMKQPTVSTQDDFFSGKDGECEMNFIDNNTANSFRNKDKDTLIIAFFRPKYRDVRMVKMEIPLSPSKQPEASDPKPDDEWQAIDQLIDYIETSKLQIIKKDERRVSYTINSKQTLISMDSVKITLSYQQNKGSVLLPICFIFFNGLLLALSQLVTTAKIIPERISLLTLYHSVTFMLFLSVLQLLIGIAQLPSSHSWFILSGILTVLLAIRMIQIFQEAVQRMIGIRGYLIFYISLFSYLWLLLNYGDRDWLLVLNSLGLVPQIVHNIRFGNRLGCSLPYLCILVSNQLYVIYMRGCAENILRYEPKSWICSTIVFLTWIQVTFIALQSWFGPLFFVPKILIPGYHNYFQILDLNTSNQLNTQECPICLCKLAQNPQTVAKLALTSEQQLKSLNRTKKDDEKAMKKVIMKTPCGHFFHRQCLNDWMEYKPECPVDRSSLPPIL